MTRRPQPVRLDLGGRIVEVRDQAPLHKGNLHFDEGWSMARLVEYLNGHVFFWPGGADGPIDYGRRHWARQE